MNRKKNKMELTENGKVREYDGEIESNIIRVIDLDFLFNKVLKHIPVKYDLKTNSIEFLYLGKYYYIDYSNKLKEQINNGNNNIYYDQFKKRIKDKINDSVMMQFDYDNHENFDLSNIVLYHKVLEEEYKNTYAKISRNAKVLSLDGLLAVFSIVLPYTLLRNLGVDVSTSLAITGLSDFFLYIISYSNGDIYNIRDKIYNLIKNYKIKKVLLYKLDEIEEYIDDIIAIKNINNSEDHLLCSINDLMNNINKLSKTKRIYYVSVIRKIIKNYINLCDELVCNNINIEHFNNIVNRFEEAITDMNNEISGNIQLKLRA